MIKLARFGTGTSAERVWTTISQLPGLQFVAVADNNAKRHGASWNGLTIGSVADLLRREWDFVVIASQWHAEIGAQLIAAGVAPERLAVFEPWGEGGLVAGVRRWPDLFPPRDARTAAAVPGFEEDFAALALLRKHGFAPRVVLDVGASSGPWSVTCARVFPEAKYYMVEPLPHYESQLLTEVAAGWHRLPLALGAEDGEITITLPESRFGAFGATALPFASGAPAGTDTHRVPLRRIDTLLAEGVIEPPQLVKLDVQGYEDAVLAGGEKLWGHTEAFFVELSLDRYWSGAKVLHEMTALFAARGYYPFEFFHAFRGDSGMLKQIDCVFLRGNGPVACEHSLWRTLEG